MPRRHSRLLPSDPSKDDEMPKMKTHRATAKRFRISRTGKILHRKATGNHFLTKKTGGRRRRIERMGVVTAERTTIRRLLGK
jgi:large subunit ribosomal protein L35